MLNKSSHCVSVIFISIISLLWRLLFFFLVRRLIFFSKELLRWPKLGTSVDPRRSCLPLTNSCISIPWFETAVRSYPAEYLSLYYNGPRNKMLFPPNAHFSFLLPRLIFFSFSLFLFSRHTFKTFHLSNLAANSDPILYPPWQVFGHHRHKKIDRSAPQRPLFLTRNTETRFRSLSKIVVVFLLNTSPRGRTQRETLAGEGAAGWVYIPGSVSGRGSITWGMSARGVSNWMAL